MEAGSMALRGEDVLTVDRVTVSRWLHIPDLPGFGRDAADHQLRSSKQPLRDALYLPPASNRWRLASKILLCKRILYMYADKRQPG
jgi:hypothetical protein